MKLRKYIFFSIGLLSLASCEDKLELQDPNNTGSEVALINDTNVKRSLLGAYDNLSAGAFFGGNTLRNSELMAANNEVVFSGTFNDVSDLYRKEMITSNADVTNMWLAAYATINTANNILSALSVVNEDDRDQVEGEALFLRGLCYFELIQFFAQPYSAGNTSTNLGVPLMLVEDRNSTDPIGRSTVDEIYTQIVSDLTDAEAKLSPGAVSNRASSEVAAAVLSRVYLQMGNYAGARDAANRVIASGEYGINGAVSDCFNDATTGEDIFDIPVTTIDGINNMVIFYAAAVYGGRGDVEIQPAHLALYEANDDRADLFYIDPGTGETRTAKWSNQFSNVKIIRLAEMYLTRAECNQRLATTVGDTPLDDVNVIRERANLLPLVTVSLAAILNERKLELAHEGQRLHDAKRLQQSISQGATTFTYNDEMLVFPIPLREMNVNPGLTGQQNPGYGN